MHARVVTGQSQPNKQDEETNVYRDNIVPAAREQKGFKGAFLLTNPNTNKFISITLWETEADMMAGEASGYLKEQLDKAAATFAGPPTTEHFEVSVQA
jgi:heme-degrading monooxygenase HmoA